MSNDNLDYSGDQGTMRIVFAHPGVHTVRLPKSRDCRVVRLEAKEPCLVTGGEDCPIKPVDPLPVEKGRSLTLLRKAITRKLPDGDVEKIGDIWEEI